MVADLIMLPERRKKTRFNDVERLFLVFDELQKHAGDDVSSAEILRAAQQLIKISRSEYLKNPYIDHPSKHNYYSRNTSTAINGIPWRIYLQESKNLLDIDFTDYSKQSKDRFRTINLNTDDYIWEL